ncbi:MAG: VacJ family lipoprotein [Parasphingorhabdus sp.]|uniref:MlaA family lipoprotein n=1 Tax=Parasphingorhabdus sp. TaxID=2709688 RepID=UPI00329775A6
MSFSEFAIAMALAHAPATATPPPTIADQPIDVATAEVQDRRAPVSPVSPISPISIASLSAQAQLFGALAIAPGEAAQAEPSAPPAPAPWPVPLEPVPLETDSAPPVLDDPLLPVDPAALDEAATDQADGNEIVVTARPRPPKSDPLQGLNADTFSTIQNVDEAVVGPVALAYEDTVPGPVRSGLSNFLSNLGEPIVFLNYLLQLKPGKAIETLGRFTINSTIGIGGLVDVAKRPPFNLPKRQNGFANTLGYYGVEPGPFLFLPLIGPTTVRDLFGRVVDLSVLPVAVGKPFNQLVYTLPAGIITSLDFRAEQDEQLRALRESNDPYTATRELYLQQRQAEIDALRGKEPEE